MARQSFEGFPQPKKDAGGTKTGDATATAPNILIAKTAYGPNGKIVGSMPDHSLASLGGGYVSPISVKADNSGDLVFETPTGFYTSGVNGGGFGSILANDPNFLAANIRGDKSIFGLAGSLPINTGDKIVTGSGSAGQILGIVPNSFWNGSDRLVLQDANFIAANIPNGMSMFGLVGSGINAKRVASGTVTSSSGQIVVTGLTFRPRLVIAWFASPTATNRYDMLTLFDSGFPANNGTSGYTAYVSEVTFASTAVTNTPASVNPINATGFTVGVGFNATSYGWVAYE